MFSDLEKRWRGSPRRFRREKPQGFLMSFAEENYLYIVAGICERRDDKFFNSAVLISPNGNIEIYRKAHLFYEEKMWFSPGDTPVSVYNVKKARIGIMICYDWFFPEAIRVLSLKDFRLYVTLPI